MDSASSFQPMPDPYKEAKQRAESVCPNDGTNWTCEHVQEPDRSADTEAVVSVSLGDLTTLLAMARTVKAEKVNAYGREVLNRMGTLIQAASLNPNLALTQEMIERLHVAGIRTRRAAVALTITERDKVLDVAAWCGIEDDAWQAALKMLQHNDGSGGGSDGA